MTLPSPVGPQSASHTASLGTLPRRGAGYIFGVPFGDLGWFATILMSLVSGFIAFFLATFVGIAGVMVYTVALHRPADYAISYRLVGLPVGLLVLAVATSYLVTLRVRRILRSGRQAQH